MGGDERSERESVKGGTWAKDTRFRPASPELKCFSLPPLSVTFYVPIGVTRQDPPTALNAHRPSSMATAEPKTNPNKPTQHAYNKLVCSDQNCSSISSPPRPSAPCSRPNRLHVPGNGNYEKKFPWFVSRGRE
ncbi:uncharacterized [Tachysurus ichikawai]